MFQDKALILEDGHSSGHALTLAATPAAVVSSNAGYESQRLPELLLSFKRNRYCRATVSMTFAEGQASWN